MKMTRIDSCRLRGGMRGTMWEGSYAAERFDFRLTMLRMMRSMGWIVLFTLLGTCLFGGGYYVKNVLLGEKAQYEMTVTCKMEYTTPPVRSGDYYINEMTWNTYLDSQEFLGMVEQSAPFVYMDVTADMWVGRPDGMAGALSAAVASDIHIPSFTVSTPDASKTQTLCKTLQEVLTGPFAESLSEVASIRVIDVSEPELVRSDVRPVRALILSAMLSFFFVTVVFLLREIGADSIWLPVTLRSRYGIKALGTIWSPELRENLKHLFDNKRKIAVCTVEDTPNPRIVIEILQDILQECFLYGQEAPAVQKEDSVLQKKDLAVQKKDSKVSRDARREDKEDSKEDSPGEEGTQWLAVPAPILCLESAEALRRADGVLLVVQAGLHAGKPLEYVLEFLAEQDIDVTAALLWNADELLIRSYYLMGRER